MTLPERIQAAIDTLEALVAKHYTIIHGDTTDVISTDNGDVPCVAKKMNDIGATIIGGFDEGYLIVVENDAGRAAAQAGQIAQMLWQKDTAKLYIASSLTVGDFALHPLQTSISAPEAAVAALADVVAAIEAWRALVDSNDDGVVSQALAIKAVEDSAAPAADRVVVYGKGPTGAGAAKTLVTPRYYELFASLGTGTPTALDNPYSRSMMNGMGFGVGASGRMMAWGNQTVAGVFGRGTASTGPHIIQPAALQNNVIRPLPTFSPLSRKVVKVITGTRCSHVLLDDGTICAAGPATTGIWDIYGSNSATAQNTLQAIYFNASSANKPMVDFDACSPSHASYAYGSLIAIDTDGAVWIMTANPNAIGYSNSLTTAQKTPLNISAGVSGWTGKTATKVRCTGFGGFIVLMSDNTLWAASGVNPSGFLGLGSTSTLSNFTQIATGVNDFEFAGNYEDPYFQLFILQGSTLKGAGYNGYGTMGQGDTVNKTSFVTISTDIAKVRLGGEYPVSLIAQKTNGTMWGVGFNTTGALGTGGTSSVTTLTSLAALDALVTAHTSAVDWCISGFGASNSSAIVMSSGRGFATGANDLGQLGVGDFTDRSAWTEVLWSPIAAGEKLIAVQPFLANARGHFRWLTDMGRILVSGYDSDFGHTSGIPGTLNMNQSTLTPIRLP